MRQMTEDCRTIRLEVREGVATLTLNRPDRLNSFNEQMHLELRAALDTVRAGRVDASVRALVITGAGRGFAPARICPTVRRLTRRPTWAPR